MLNQQDERRGHSLLAASILGADWLQFGRAIEIAQEAGADLIQVDIADGHFVPTISFGEELVRRIRENSKLLIEVHLMVSQPQDWIRMMADIGADYVLFHAEVVQCLHAMIELARNAGIGVGVVLNSESHPNLLTYVLPYIDIVTLMGIIPGFAGQTYLPETTKKIQKLRTLIDDTGVPVLIEVDGGVKQKITAELVHAGADILVASSAIYKASDPVAAGKQMKDSMALPVAEERRMRNIGAFLAKQ